MTAARVPDPTARPRAEAASARARPRHRSWGAPTLDLVHLDGGTVSAQSLPTFAIPTTSSSDRPNSEQAFVSVEIHERPAPASVVYHLSADPGALIAENHVYDVPDGIGVYLDESSRYVTVRDNVFDGLGLWVDLNALDGAHPRRTAADNVARGNWHNAGKANGSWSDYANSRLVDNVAVEGQAWPEDARKVIDRASPTR